MLAAEQLRASAPAAMDAPQIRAAASVGQDVDPIWVIAHALVEAASSCEEVLVVTQVCRSWRSHINTVKEELYGAILPRKFPRLRYLSLVLEPSKQLMRLSKEEQYRRHIQAQVELCPEQEVCENLYGRPLMDPDIACTLELWLDGDPVLFAALSTSAQKQQDPDCSPLTELLKDMHTKEEQFFKDVVEDDTHQRDLQPEALAAMYDAMNKYCGWDKLSVMMYVSNGDEVVRVFRAAFLFAVHDRYLFGNALEIPKLVLSQDGMIGLPMQQDQQLEVGAVMKDYAVGERVIIHGLKTSPQHNSKEGTVGKYIEESGRFRIDLDTGEAIAIKSSNMRLATNARATLTVEDKQYVMSLKLGIFVNPVLIAEVLANIPNVSQQLA